MITCFIGLHHIPKEKMDDFLSSLRRILRPGGSFIIMDHDVTNQKTRDMACLAHSVYNAVMGVSEEEEEQNEIRNFHSLNYWKAKLAEHGFEAVKTHNRMIRSGDPSENVMIRLVKKSHCAPKASHLHHEHKYSSNRLHQRSKICTPLYQQLRTQKTTSMSVKISPKMNKSIKCQKIIMAYKHLWSIACVN